MKDWQYGYELEYLKSIESKYEEYNRYTLSPFAKYKKNNIAESLHKGTLISLGDETMMEVATSKVASEITMYGSTFIAKKLKGDVTISKLVGDTDLIKSQINSLNGKSFWLYVWAENKKHCDLAEECGFCYVGPKITTYGEVYAIYYKGEARDFPKVDPGEFLSVKKVDDVDSLIIDSIREKIKNLPAFTNHYSNYNKDNSWSAISLRGYSPDPSFITKPIEMNDKWKEQHKINDFFIQDTELYELFPEIKTLLSRYGNEIHRVRFMKLKPGGGELERHTDQVDPDSGGCMGKLSRLHFPIITNEKVNFTVWDTKGNPQHIHMSENECWFLDTRKPHMAINAGDEDRIHLVVDVVTEKDLYDRLLNC